ncbi:MAG: hypothetical protein JSU74_08860 [Candidatus Zixiibacteriota bacterium]|nr:MAG: hypothetical protein JSU74_08860 [candidate division Zixibacteria bacterium]
MSTIERSVCLVLAAVCLFAGEAVAGRLFGNATLSYERISQDGDDGVTDDVTRETAILNYEDVLFYKNHIRLTANLQRREESFSDYHEFIPIYYLDLKSYGYAVNVRYSPYKRRGITVGGVDVIDVYYRDWRVTTQLNYTGYPTFNMVYSRLSNFDREAVRRFDGYNRNWVLESSHRVDPVSLRANYSNLKQVNNLAGGSETLTESYSGTFGFNEAVSGLGFLSVTYNYYDTRRETGAAFSQNSNTHSLNSIAIIDAIEKLSANVSYSGMFTSAEQQAQTSENTNQNISALLEFTPTGYLSFQTSKGYQESERQQDRSVTEYLNVGVTVTRYFRNGVDTRLTYNRTFFQRSPRVAPVTDTAGVIIGTVDAGKYNLDTYQASLNFSPRPYIKTYLDLGLTRDSDPLDEQRRYQLTRSVDMRFDFSRKLEGRFRLTTQYLGEKLRLDRSFSDNYNLGLTFIPRGNINLNATYIYTDFKTAARSSLSSVSGYFSYSFRRAFTFYISVNDQIQKREVATGDDEFTETETRPRSVNGQLLMYLSRKVTLSLGYLRSRTQNAAGEKIINESVQGVLSIQI